ncbi:MAG: Uma2 family endonuclease [Vulcanimicrobiota bacterium]
MADAAQPIRIILTYEDYCELPVDGRRYEIVEGELVMNPAPSLNHQRVSRKLEFILIEHVEKNQLGEIFDAPFDVLFSDITVMQPDIVFISREHSSILTERGVTGAPDLVIEILSPGTSRLDRFTKFQTYSRYGVSWYWIVDPDLKSLDEYRLHDDGYIRNTILTGHALFQPGIFPGLEIPLTDIWPA